MQILACFQSIFWNGWNGERILKISTLLLVPAQAVYNEDDVEITPMTWLESILTFQSQRQCWWWWFWEPRKENYVQRGRKVKRQVNPNELHHNALHKQMSYLPSAFPLPWAHTPFRAQMTGTLSACMWENHTHFIRWLLFLMWEK